MAGGFVKTDHSMGWFMGKPLTDSNLDPQSWQVEANFANSKCSHGGAPQSWGHHGETTKHRGYTMDKPNW